MYSFPQKDYPGECKGERCSRDAGMCLIQQKLKAVRMLYIRFHKGKKKKIREILSEDFRLCGFLSYSGGVGSLEKSLDLFRLPPP